MKINFKQPCGYQRIVKIEDLSIASLVLILILISSIILTFVSCKIQQGNASCLNSLAVKKNL